MLYNSDSDDEFSPVRPATASKSTNGTMMPAKPLPSSAKIVNNDIRSSILNISSVENVTASPRSTATNLISNDSSLQEKLDRMKLAAERSLTGMNPYGGMVQASRPLSAVGTRMNGFTPAPPIQSVPTSPPSSFRNYSQQSATISSPVSSTAATSKNLSPASSGLLEVEEVQDDFDQQHQLSTPKKTTNLFSNQFDIVNNTSSPPSTTPRQTFDKIEPTGVNNFFNNIPPAIVNQSSSEVSTELQLTKKVEISDMKSFFLNPTPKEFGLVRCYIIRERTSFSKFFPKFYLFLEDGDRFLMSARRRKKNKTANYLISLDKDDLSRKGSSFFGKMRGNFLGTEFIIYDNGENPKKLSETNKDVRNQYAGILYEQNVLGTKGPRKLTVCVPSVGQDGKYFPYPQLKDRPSIVEKYKDKDWKHLYIFKNQGPQWNERLKAYVLNFNGRVTKASVKNFQLVATDETSTVYLQFGKVDDNKFTLDFRYPISPYIAFCVALTSLDVKIGCE